MNDNTERRKHKRYPLKKEAYAVLSPDYSAMGKIIDISKGGVAYFCPGTLPQDEIDIYCPSSDYIIKKIKVKAISNIDLTTSGDGKYSRKRRCSLQFVLLTHGQEVALDHFFKNYTNPDK